MKKVELHIHLDGSLRVNTVSEILNIDKHQCFNNMVVKDNNQDLSEYLTKFDLPLRAMQTKENIKRVSKELAVDLKNDGIIYAEVRFAPQFHTNGGLTYEEVVEAAIEGANEVSDIKINFLLCMMRGASYDNNLKTILVTEKYLKKGVVGIDLAGDEKLYKTKDYKELFDIARNKNIPFTIHAGEADGVQSVMDAISFGAKRIGHGIKILEDQNVLDAVIKNNILLEVCPTSNVQTKIVDFYEKHPVKKLFDKGVLMSINTDNNTVSNIGLSQEYYKLVDCFDFKKDDLLQFNINAIKASFMDEKEKEKYIKILKGVE